MAELSKQIKALDQQKATQNDNNTALQGQLKKQADRVISNIFARFYWGEVTKAFDKWKHTVN